MRGDDGEELGQVVHDDDAVERRAGQGRADHPVGELRDGDVPALSGDPPFLASQPVFIHNF